MSQPHSVKQDVPLAQRIVEALLLKDIHAHLPQVVTDPGKIDLIALGSPC